MRPRFVFVFIFRMLVGSSGQPCHDERKQMLVISMAETRCLKVPSILSLPLPQRMASQLLTSLTPEAERPRHLHMREETHLEGDLILLPSPDLQARVVSAQLPEPLPVHSKQPSSHHGRPVGEGAWCEDTQSEGLLPSRWCPQKLSLSAGDSKASWAGCWPSCLPLPLINHCILT